MAQLLLDTHVALWWLAGEPMSGPATEALAEPTNRLVYSIASAWEVVIKQGQGRLEIDGDHLEALREQGVDLLDITTAHLAAVRGLPRHHRDPFGRMLIAQAQVERLTLVTRDSRFAAYGVGVLEA